MQTYVVVDEQGRRKRNVGADGMLGDGEYLAVPTPAFTMVFNKHGEAVRLGDAALKLVDSRAAPLADHRPGFRLPATTTADFQDGAAIARQHMLGEAWRSPAVADSGTRTADARAAYVDGLQNAWRRA